MINIEDLRTDCNTYEELQNEIKKLKGTSWELYVAINYMFEHNRKAVREEVRRTIMSS